VPVENDVAIPIILAADIAKNGKPRVIGVSEPRELVVQNTRHGFAVNQFDGVLA
jgi:hypothetical protein